MILVVFVLAMLVWLVVGFVLAMLRRKPYKKAIKYMYANTLIFYGNRKKNGNHNKVSFLFSILSHKVGGGGIEL